MNQLKEVLRELCDQEGLPLCGQLQLIEEHAKPILRRVQRACQKAGYTYHGIEHVRHVGRLLHKLIPRHLLGYGEEQINPYELFILMGAAYLHDVGMLRPKDRATHNVVSASQVYDFEMGRSCIEGLDDQYAYRISRLCLAHRDHREDGKRVDTLAMIKDDNLAGQRVKMRLLGCLLRLADELDANFERAPEDLELGLPLSEDSQMHWVTHQLIDSVNIDALRWEIELCPSESARRDQSRMGLVGRRRDKIQSELDRMQPILKDTSFAYKEVIIAGVETVAAKTIEAQEELAQL